jgi:hypothetical protein
MAWLEAHSDLESHYKTLDLMADMGWDLDTTIGKLFRFWWWCQKYAEDGDLRRHNDERLGGAVGLNRDESKKFVEAMLRACWLEREPYFRVHDWWQYIGPWLRSKYKRQPKKWEAVRDMYGLCTGYVTANQTNQTKPTNQARVGEGNGGLVKASEAARVGAAEYGLGMVYPDGFLAFWDAYPRKLGQKAAIDAWYLASPDGKLQQAILTALEKQKRVWTDPQFIPAPARWLSEHRWKDEINVPADDVAARSKRYFQEIEEGMGGR